MHNIFFVWIMFLVDLVVGDQTEVSNFQKLFMQKRIEQLTAVKNVLQLDESKRKILLDQITTKLFQVLSTGRSDLENSGFVAGLSSIEPGPVMEKVSLVMENTCLASDLLLRLPEEMTRRIESNSNWNSAFKWAIGFTQETGLLDDSSLKLMALVSQELGLVERDPSYINPYRQEKKQHKRFEDPPLPKKKEKKKIKRGPKMSHNEL